MADIDNTKAKLLRGVVQDNVDVVQGVRTKHAARRRLYFRYWLSACIALIGIAYLVSPSQVVSTANNSADEAIGTVSAANIAQTPESAGTLNSPRAAGQKGRATVDQEDCHRSRPWRRVRRRFAVGCHGKGDNFRRRAAPAPAHGDRALRGPAHAPNRPVDASRQDGWPSPMKTRAICLFRSM